MDRLVNLTEDLAAKYNSHRYDLSQAQNLTYNILDELQGVTASVATVRESLLGASGVGTWWPYVVFPIGTLVVGSYGLPSSVLRNLALAALGELGGIVVVHRGEITSEFVAFVSLHNLTAPDNLAGYDNAVAL